MPPTFNAILTVKTSFRLGRFFRWRRRTQCWLSWIACAAQCMRSIISKLVPGGGNLFVNVQLRLLESVKDDHGQAFAKVLDLIGVATSRVVIETPAEVNRNWKLLGHVIGNYRSRGYRIAANHSGTGENWMAELGGLYPDIVRLEASALMGRLGARALIDSIHRFGASVLVYEIETPQHKAAALQEGADLLQGRALGVPVRAVEPSVPVPVANYYPVPPSGDYRQKSFRGSPD